LASGAFDEKCPKLVLCASGLRKSILVLECDDIQHANFSNGFDAVKTILAERDVRADIIDYVETDAFPWSGRVFKDGELLGNRPCARRLEAFSVREKPDS
jgi:hypothetical protein